jgi:hypothetical protein
MINVTWKIPRLASSHGVRGHVWGAAEIMESFRLSFFYFNFQAVVKKDLLTLCNVMRTASRLYFGLLLGSYSNRLTKKFSTMIACCIVWPQNMSIKFRPI